ncbi:MAG: single-stranded-DNA-specific exonuclease RecJ [Candidatus Methylacidiphilales bacterium]
MKDWNIRNGVVDGITEEEVLHRLVAFRGYEEEAEIDDFLHPKLKNLQDPCRIPDLEKAVHRVDAALRAQEEILIFSDYDVDGMSSGALMFRFLIALGGRVRVLIPERFSEGYGLSIEALERAMERQIPGLVICLDCGTTSVDEVAWLKQRGIDVVIIDHHELPSVHPAADAFVNPQCGNFDHDLATVGLVFKFLHGFLKLTKQSDSFDLKAHLDLVALGTISDLVALRGDNRIFVHYGLQQLARTEHVGLRELMRVAGVKRRPVPSTVGFLLGPRLNASGRLTSAKEGWRLLTTRDEEQAKELAESLDALNRERQKVELEVFEEALKMTREQEEAMTRGCVVVASSNWHQGVIGIVASRLQRIWNRPTVVVSLDENGNGKGSGRSIKGCSLMDALRDCQGLLRGFGGHAMAAGIEIDADRIGEFRTAMNDWFLKHAEGELVEESLDVEMELPGRLLNLKLAQEIGRMEPFGQMNPSPLFAVRGVKVTGRPRFFGKNHVRFRGHSEGAAFDAVAFGLCEGEMPARELDLAGHWEMDDFTGAPCFRVVDWRF